MSERKREGLDYTPRAFPGARAPDGPAPDLGEKLAKLGVIEESETMESRASNESAVSPVEARPGARKRGGLDYTPQAFPGARDPDGPAPDLQDRLASMGLISEQPDYRPDIRPDARPDVRPDASAPARSVRSDPPAAPRPPHKEPPAAPRPAPHRPSTAPAPSPRAPAQAPAREPARASAPPPPRSEWTAPPAAKTSFLEASPPPAYVAPPPAPVSPEARPDPPPTPSRLPRVPPEPVPRPAPGTAESPHPEERRSRTASAAPAAPRSAAGPARGPVRVRRLADKEERTRLSVRLASTVDAKLTDLSHLRGLDRNTAISVAIVQDWVACFGIQGSQIPH